MRLSDARRAKLLALSWYALRVDARKETAVAMLLDGRGFDTFVPTGWHPRRISSRRRKRIEFTGPILAGYCLIGFDRPAPWPDVHDASIHIRGVVAMDGAPSPLSLVDMILLFASHECESLVPCRVQERPARRERFKRCRAAQVIDGLLRGEIVTVGEIRGNNAEITLEAGAAGRPILMPVDNLDPID